MMLERLEELKKISTKNVIVNEVVNGLDRKSYYNKFELEINLSLVLFTLLGNTKMHEEMAREDIDWISFVNDNYKLVVDLKNGEYKEDYEEIFAEILKGAEAKVKYNLSLGGILENLGEIFTEENLQKLQEVIEKNKKEEVIE